MAWAVAAESKPQAVHLALLEGLEVATSRRCL